jgi:hypothetical protein
MVCQADSLLYVLNVSLVQLHAAASGIGTARAHMLAKVRMARQVLPLIGVV